MVTAEAFIEKVRVPLDQGWGYIYGTWGTLWTEKKQQAATREMTVKYGSKWIGHMVTDCSGLPRWALHQLGESIVHHARYQYTNWCTNKGKLINGRREDGTVPLPGTAVFLQGKEAHIHHVGVYIGADTVIEAKGTVYGVVTSRLNHWDHWGELKMVDYTDAAKLEREEIFPKEDTQENAQAGTIFKAIVSNPNRFLNVRAGGSGSAQVEFQVEKGDVVEVLDAGEPDWWQIRYGSRIGWASAKFLTPIKPAEGPAPDEAPEQEPEAPDIPADRLTALLEEALEDVRKAGEALNDLIRILSELQDGEE